ncbi:DUF4411 family protein [Deefgea rivuli]|uniref:DUF4411 family protein n=1 Tax=Deefgea rivuli TaxID=400948 RepID=UPI000484964C|nr:DUF4411 family protein [Deefgea rivuli]
MRYLLDSNTFIQAKNFYYNPAFCPAYWDWIQQKHSAAVVSSICFVAEELEKGNDFLSTWVKEYDQFFIDVDDQETQEAYQQIVKYVAEHQDGMKPNAMPDFLSGADPWLIAKAIVIGSTIVTQEKKDPLNKKKFLIPNIAAVFGMKCINTFELLSMESAVFKAH